MANGKELLLRTTTNLCNWFNGKLALYLGWNDLANVKILPNPL